MSYPEVDRLLWVMAQLRDPEQGCPWDKQQTFESIVPYTIEEAYEVADAIEQGDMQDVREELGDLLFQVVFYAQLGKENGDFDFEAIAKTVADKLISRHPHVFEQQSDLSEEELHNQWEKAKQQERADKGKDTDLSILANVPVGMGPLIRAHKLQKKCAKVGFDWPDHHQVVDKIHEEVGEVLDEVDRGVTDQNAVEEEVGDLLFAVVNLARHLKVDADTALRKANHKFEKRFRALETDFAKGQTSLENASLEEMESVWLKVKNNPDI